MNILIISPQVPYPLTDGGRIGVFFPIKYLSSRGHHITLLCLSESNDQEAVEYLRKYCDVNIILHQKKPQILKVISSLFKDIPYDIKRYESQDLLKLINDKIAVSSFDIIQVEGIHSAFYGIEVRKRWNVPLVMRAHNIHYLNFFRFISQVKNPIIKVYLYLESYKVKKYEAEKGQCFDRVLCVSKIDREKLLSLNSKIKCDVIEAGVEIDESSSEPNIKVDNVILWIGALQWKPNQDSLFWFIEDIFPKIIQKLPNSKLQVIGSNPPKGIAKLHRYNIDIIGMVDDVKPFLKKATVCIVPLRIGSGIRLKILEMFAMKKAVVSTSIGCEGLPVRNGEHLLVADDPDEFAESVVKILKNPEMGINLGRSGFNLVKENYSWSSITEKLEKIYKKIIEEYHQ